MFDDIAAIDIGTHGIRVARIKTGLRDFQIKAFAFQDIDTSIEDRTAAIGEAFDRIIEEEDFRDAKVITNLPMEKAVIRTLNFPFNDMDKIAGVVPFEAEENIPFNMDDLILDFQPLKSPDDQSGRVLVAASMKKNIENFLSMLNAKGIFPDHMGLETNALLECYRYFNEIDGEAILQLNIGHEKTIINIIEDNQLLFTRSIPIGIGDIHREVADELKMDYKEAVSVFENLNIDLTSLENNVQRSHYKTLGLTKPKLKKIFTITRTAVDNLIEQIYLTLKALFVEFGKIEYNRVLLSGGGANIAGIGNMIAGEFDMPVVAQPFLENYTESEINTGFPVVFGTLLSFLKNRRGAINFLKDEFMPAAASSRGKMYYLAGGFAVLTVFILIINLVSSLIMTAIAKKDYRESLRSQFKQYFKREPSEDPIADARKILKKEKKEIEEISTIFPLGASTLDFLKEILQYFPGDANFQLKNLVINKRIVRIDGTIDSSTKIEEFKQKLLQSKKFESVTMNIKYSRGNEVRFAMNIKQKLEDSGK